MLVLNDVSDKCVDPPYFVHIPKCAGTSMVNIHGAGKWMVSSGHAHPLVIGFKFGWDQAGNIRFAVFRDPWDRAVSLLEFGRANSKSTRLGWTSEPLYTVDKVAMMQRFLEQIHEEKQDPYFDALEKFH